MIRLLLAEDQARMRSALALLLNLEDDMEVVAEVGDAESLLAAASRSRPDVALIDIELPGRSGLDVAAELVTVLPGCAIVIVTTFARPGYVQRAMAVGARGFVAKDGPVEALVDAIRQVVAGATVIDPELARHALRSGASPLTERERAVLVEAEHGGSTSDIAGRLHLSRSTVRNYLSGAIGKTATRTRTEAARVARRNGWL